MGAAAGPDLLSGGGGKLTNERDSLGCTHAYVDKVLEISVIIFLQYRYVRTSV